jgi:hypothetical protein
MKTICRKTIIGISSAGIAIIYQIRVISPSGFSGNFSNIKDKNKTPLQNRGVFIRT